jgi:hypothetical protein
MILGAGKEDVKRLCVLFFILGALLFSVKMGKSVDEVVTASSRSSIVDGGVISEGLVAEVLAFVLAGNKEEKSVAAAALIEGSTAVFMMLAADANVLRRGDGAAIETASSSTSNLDVAAAAVDAVVLRGGISSLMMRW